MIFKLKVTRVDIKIRIMSIQHISSQLRTEPSKCNFAIQNIIIKVPGVARRILKILNDIQIRPLCFRLKIYLKFIFYPRLKSDLQLEIAELNSRCHKDYSFLKFKFFFTVGSVKLPLYDSNYDF